VRRTVVTENDTVGVWCEPEQGADDVVVVLGGSMGGFPEVLATQLAERGIGAFALGYFGAPGLPSALVEIPVETVQRGLDVVRQRVGGGRAIGVMGMSKGAELALLSASYIDDIGPVVAVAPSCVAWYGIDISDLSAMTRASWTWHGTPVPFLPLQPNVMPLFTEAGIRTDVCYDLSRYSADEVDAARIRVERSRGPILLLSGDDDHQWPSAPMAAAIVDRMQTHGDADRISSVVYQGAGHTFLVRDFLPASNEGTRPSFDFGGGAEADRSAAERGWSQIVSFLTHSPA
jgi:dienelactone hydrolase